MKVISKALKFFLLFFAVFGIFNLFNSNTAFALNTPPVETFCQAGSVVYQCGGNPCTSVNQKRTCTCVNGLSWSCTCAEDPMCAGATPPASQCPAGQQLCSDGSCKSDCNYQAQCSWTDNRPNCAGDGTFCGNPQLNADGNGYHCPGYPDWYYCCPGLVPNASGICGCPVCNVSAPTAPSITSPTNNQQFNNTASVALTWALPGSYGSGCPDNKYILVEQYEKNGASYTLINSYVLGEGALSQNLSVTAGKTYTAVVYRYNSGQVASASVTFSILSGTPPVVSQSAAQADVCGSGYSGSLDYKSASNLVTNPVTWIVNSSIPAGTEFSEFRLLLAQKTGTYAENSASPAENILMQKVVGANSIGVRIFQNGASQQVYTLSGVGSWAGGVTTGDLNNSLGSAVVLGVGTQTVATIAPAGALIGDNKTVSAQVTIQFNNTFPTSNYNVYITMISKDADGNFYSYNTSTSNPNTVYNVLYGGASWGVDTFAPTVTLTSSRSSVSNFQTVGSVSDSIAIKDYRSYVKSDLAGANVNPIGAIPTADLVLPPNASNPATLSLTGTNNFTDTNPGLGATYTFRLAARDLGCNIGYQDEIVAAVAVNNPWIVGLDGNISMTNGTNKIEVPTAQLNTSLGSLVNGLNYITTNQLPRLATYLAINNQGNLTANSSPSLYNQVLNGYSNDALTPPEGNSWYDYIKNNINQKNLGIVTMDSINIGAVDVPEWGTALDGNVTLSSTFNLNSSTTNNRSYADGVAYRVDASTITSNSVTRYNTSFSFSNGISAGDEVLLINLQGASGDTVDVGNYEFLRVSSVTASQLVFSSTITRSYDGSNGANQKVVVQRIPNYKNVTVSAGATVTASAWDGLATAPSGTAGYRTGIVAFRAYTMTIGSGATISATQLGYRGTQTAAEAESTDGYVTRGGTTGATGSYGSNAIPWGGNGGGGGGGGSVSAGGSGASSPDAGCWGGAGGGGGGGSPYTVPSNGSSDTKLYLGSGGTRGAAGGNGGGAQSSSSSTCRYDGKYGGAGGSPKAASGTPGNGGGIVLISAGAISNSGTIRSIGGNGSAGGAGGGGEVPCCSYGNAGGGGGGGGRGGVGASGGTIVLNTTSTGISATVTGGTGGSGGAGGSGGTIFAGGGAAGATGSSGPAGYAVVGQVSLDGNVVFDDTPTRYYRLGETSGTTAVNTMGGNNGTYVNSPTLGVNGAISGDFNTAVTFDGNNDYVDIPNVDVTTKSFSAEAWVKPSASGIPATQSPLSFSGSGTSRFVLYSNGDLLFAVANGEAVSSGPGKINFGSWNHIVYTYDYASDVSNLYINGNLAGTNNAGPVLDTKTTAYIGTEFPGFTHWKGEIDEVAIYNRPLIAVEVSEHYTAGVSGSLYSIIKDNYSPVLSSALGVAPGSLGYFEYTGDLTIPSGTVCDVRALLLINGNVNITPDFTTTTGNGCLFVVKGGTAKLRSKVKPASPVNYDFVQGAFITDTPFMIEDSDGANGLILEGSVLSLQNAALYRKLTLQNSDTYPSLIFKFDPRYRIIFAEALSVREYSIREE